MWKMAPTYHSVKWAVSAELSTDAAFVTNSISCHVSQHTVNSLYSLRPYVKVYTSTPVTLGENSIHFELNRMEINPFCARMKRILRNHISYWYPICRDENRTKIVPFDETTQGQTAPLRHTYACLPAHKWNLLYGVFLVSQSHKLVDTWRYHARGKMVRNCEEGQIISLCPPLRPSVRLYAWNHKRNVKTTLMKCDIEEFQQKQPSHSDNSKGLSLYMKSYARSESQISLKLL